MSMLNSFHRHPELVSGSILPPEQAVRAEKWTLKQVQGDGVFATDGVYS
jgi:hypothetical protein